MMKLDELRGLYIAHRGIQVNGIVENTISAFSLALEKKVPIELDIHVLKDGNIVVYHDDTLNRLMGIDQKISNYTYPELKKLPFPNTDSSIPLLKDVLQLIAGKVLLVIEIKKTTIYSYQEYCQKVVQLLETYSGKILIQSFDIRIVHWFLKHSHYLVGLLIADRKYSIYDFLMQRKSIISYLKPDFISVNYQLVSYRMVKYFRKEKPVFVWTIDCQEKLEKVKMFADSYFVGEFYFYHKNIDF